MPLQAAHGYPARRRGAGRGMPVFRPIRLSSNHASRCARPLAHHAQDAPATRGRCQPGSRGHGAAALAQGGAGRSSRPSRPHEGGEIDALAPQCSNGLGWPLAGASVSSAAGHTTTLTPGEPRRRLHARYDQYLVRRHGEPGSDRPLVDVVRAGSVSYAHAAPSYARFGPSYANAGRGTRLNRRRTGDPARRTGDRTRRQRDPLRRSEVDRVAVALNVVARSVEGGSGVDRSRRLRALLAVCGEDASPKSRRLSDRVCAGG